MDNVSYLISFTAGIVSFLSPCVLPIVPGSIAFLAGRSIEHNEANEANSDVQTSIRTKNFFNALLFVLGFSTIFVILGASASFLGQYLLRHLHILTTLAGIIIIIFGMHMLGIFRINILNKEARFHFSYNPNPYYGPYFIGLAFGFGWTPCIGPILGSVLVYAGNQHTLEQGVILLFFYAMGLGLPFIVSACFIGYFLQYYKYVRAYMPRIQKIMAIILIITGVAISTGTITRFANWMLVHLPFLVVYS